MIPALKNKASGKIHLASDAGQAYCKERIDQRLIPFEVRLPEEITCGLCGRSKTLKLRTAALGLGARPEEADYYAAHLKPPRLLDASTTMRSRVPPQP